LSNYIKYSGHNRLVDIDKNTTFNANALSFSAVTIYSVTFYNHIDLGKIHA